MGKTIAIITARGGSKRIPKKNIRDFCGKPILSYSIEAALKSGVFDEVMVSTDSEEIAEIARKEGAAVPFFRSEKTANDFATTTDVLLEVIEEYKQRGMEFEYGCCIYPTAPFVTPEKLKTAMSLLKNQEADSVMPIVQYSFPPQRGVEVEEGLIKVKWPEYYQMRSQDLSPIYHDVGQFYCFRTDRFIASKKVVGDHCVPMIVSDLEVQDIDNEEDWKIAEMKYKLMQSEKEQEYADKR